MTVRLMSVRSVEPPASSSRYRLLRCIASGGMGSVYAGVQCGAAGFSRRVAIKRAHPHLVGSKEVREAILAEARNASTVRHPNVVSVDDVDEVAGDLLLVMEYVDGCTLARMVGTRGAIRRLPIPVAVRIAVDLCAGLDAIHSARDDDGHALGLVHRDISPQNVLLTLDGVARIADFGIAKSVRDNTRTGPTMRRGKFGYMSPEYIKDGESTASSDLFAVGVLLWESLSGHRLFEGKSELDSILLSAAADVPSLCGIVPGIPEALDAIVRRALACEPADRFPSAADFGAALESLSAITLAPRHAVATLVRSCRSEEPIPRIEAVQAVDEDDDDGTAPFDLVRIRKRPEAVIDSSPPWWLAA